MASQPTPAFLTQKQAAAYCALSESGFIKLCRKGQAPTPIYIGKLVRFETETLVKWMRAHECHDYCQMLAVQANKPAGRRA